MTDMSGEIDEQVLEAVKPATPATEAVRTLLVTIFEEKAIRIFGTVDEPLFCVTDIAAYIGDSRHCARTVNKYKLGVYVQKIEGLSTGRGRPASWYLTEVGVYKYLTQAKGKKAEEFQEFVYNLLKKERARYMAAALEAKEARLRELEAINRDLTAGNATLHAALERRVALARKVPKQIENSPDLGCLYFIGAADDESAPTKIGYTKKLPQRLKALQTANPTPLVVRRAIIVTDAAAAEERAHEHFREWHLQGEWFRLTRESIEAYEDISAVLR